jgi:hypothetical protein
MHSSLAYIITLVIGGQAMTNKILNPNDKNLILLDLEL